MNKMNRMQKRACCLGLSLVLAASNMVGYIPPREVQAAMNEAAPQAFKDLITEMKAATPKGQEWLSYSENFQSMEEEPITYLKGTGSHDKTTTTGKLTVKLNGEPTVAVFDKCPWLSSGYMDMDFKFTEATGNIGFIYKAYDDTDAGVGIRYDGGSSWVIQLWSAGGASYKSVTGPALTADKDYNFKMGFHNNKLILAIDNTVFYNEESQIIRALEKGTAQGQLGLYKRNGKGTFTISNMELAGNGTTTKPSNFITYENDYEDAAYTPNWKAGVTATVKQNDTKTNTFLELTGNGRFCDLASKPIADGSISLDYNIVKIGAGYAFGFRHDDTSASFSELGWDGGRWIAESNNGWSNTLEIPKPVEGKWNNLILNFKGKEVTVYLNKQYVGVFPFDKFTTAAGKFGLRLRGTTIQIDNVKYTSEVLAPAKINKYENNFEDGVTGEYISGTASIVSEGSNKILKLANPASGAILTDGVSLDAGTLTCKVKTDAANTLGIGFAQAENSGSELLFENNAWKIVSIVNNGLVETPIADLAAPKANTWNNIGIQFSGTSVKVSVNGVNKEVTLPAAISAAGTLGFKNASNLFVDNLLYTEEFPELSTTGTGDKVYYEEYFETIADTTVWTGLTGAAVKAGRLEGSIAAGAAATNTDLNVTANGVYQAKLNADSAKIGLQIGNAKIYHKGAGAWVLNNGQEVAIGTTDALQANQDVVVRAEIINGKLTLKINGFVVGTVNFADTLTGKFGIYNGDTKAVNVKVDAVGMEEIRVYKEDYSVTTADGWKMTGGTAAIVNGAAELTLTGVSKATNSLSPMLKNQSISLDFKANVEAADANGVSGGRYGILVREDGSNKFLSVETDVNGEWRIQTDSATVKFPTKMALIKDKTYHMDIDVVGQTVSLAITNDAGEKTELGTVSDDTVPVRAGKLGVRSWYAGKKVTLDNIQMVEMPNIPAFILDAKTTTLVKDGMTVTIDENFPRIESYVLNGKTLKAQETPVSELIINGKSYAPRVTGTKASDTLYKYQMNFAEIGVEMTMNVELKANHVVEVRVAEVKETGDTKVRTISLGDNALAMVDSSMANSSFAWTKSNGQWHGITEEITPDLKDYEGRSENVDTTMSMLSGGGLGFSMENNVMNGGAKVVLKKEIKALVNRISAGPGVFTYRHAQSDKTEELPYFKVVVTEDRNNDTVVDWQDATVAYRKFVYNQVIGSQDTSNTMMYIPFNFASQATEPFLAQLDTAKVLYNYMDGFGQMLLDKGYQAEGHDDDIPSYSNIGVRQGGPDEFNYLINEGAKYNAKVGVHLNATEPQLDANELFYQNFTGATLTGTVGTSSTDRLAKGWDWIDCGYYYDQTKDVLSGQLEKRFTDLYNLTNDNKLDPNDPTVAFYYIDVYTGNQYNGQKLLDIAHNLGIAVGTEFAGPMEPGVAFTHWGTDLGYPNKGNGSLLSRMVKNDLDIFVGNALFKGAKIPVVSTWGDSKMDIQQGVEVFFNEIVPTRFMQHYGVLKATTDEVQFEGNVISKRNKATGKVELTQNGKAIARWKDTGTTTAESERHASATDSFIPWIWDHKTYEEVGLMEGAKIYHWNTTGTEQTWDVPEFFKTVTTFDLYKTTQYGREFVKKVNVTNGKVTLDTQKNTPYVLYPATVADAKKTPAAANWGEGSPLLDFMFNSGVFNKAGSWTMTGDAVIETEAGRTEYSIAKETQINRWNKLVKFQAAGGTLSQDMKDLEPGADYTVSVWTKTEPGRKSKIKVEIGGKTYENYVTGADGNHQSNFKYRGTTFQKLSVQFHVPTGITTGKATLTADAGTGNVYYDDVKVWKHVSVETDVTNAGYVLKEDFENVDQGFGVFEYGGGSLQNHIATDRSLAKYDDNPVVTPADNKQGPVMTWVLGGQNSLKLSENGVGKLIKTNENSLKLSAEKDYNLSFEYTLENFLDYEVYLYSAKTQKYLPLTVEGTASNKVTLAPSLNSGHKDGTQKKVTATFTTKGVDMTNDYYQLFFAVKAKREGNKSIDYTMILDNIAIWEKTSQVNPGQTVEKAGLNKAIADAEALTQAGYTTESWNAMVAKLNAAKTMTAKTDATQEQVDIAKNDLEKAVRELVPANFVDKTALKNLLAEANRKVEKDYTPDSWTGFAAELSAANNVFQSTTATTASVAEAVNKLQAAMDKLEIKVTLDRSGLKALIDEFKPLLAKEAEYTKATFDSFKEALTAAEEVYGDDSADLKAIEGAIADLQAAKGQLEKVVTTEKKNGWYPEAKGQRYYVNDVVTANKWVQDTSGKWMYSDKEGYKTIKKWVSSGKSWYFMGEDGFMMASKWYKENGAWYYLQEDGKMKTGWIKDGGAWYYMASSGKMQTGWVKDGGAWYLLATSGKMLTGWQKAGGVWYYLQSSGKMKTGWLKDGGVWYYLQSSGKMKTGWLKDGGAWYYLQSSGKMKTGWLKDGASWYYLYSSGKMATGWIKVGGVEYYLYASGKMAANTRIGRYYVNSQGAYVPGK